VAGYWATDGELPLNLAIPPLAGRGQQFLLPLVMPGRELRFAPWRAGDPVQPNRYGIPEPVAPPEWFAPFQLDLVLVPLLVGIAYDFQELDAIDAEPWDVPLDYVATDRELIDCTAEALP
jgi:5-formyltetrahydrofolate cyclo-ligase